MRRPARCHTTVRFRNAPPLGLIEQPLALLLEETDKIVRNGHPQATCRPPSQRHIANDKIREKLHVFVGSQASCRCLKFLSS